ncbi:MAG: hypothetical protein QHH24_05385 [Candidatus Bathyarchaeota archaeon]|nr:hypothetical protein [Candidatus Bathyarchaeota archaeon]
MLLNSYNPRQMQMKAREGDLAETRDDAIFDVKGLVHPPDRIVAFIRYFPQKSGRRKRETTAYRKIYPLSLRFKLLKKMFPDYLVHDPVFDEILCEIPVEKVKRIYDPIKRLKEMRNSKTLDSVEDKALKLASLLKETAGIQWNSLGVSGSILVELHLPASDIDPVVYGSENCRKVYSALQDLLHDQHSHFTSYTVPDLRRLFAFRSRDTKVSFEDFVRTEPRKFLQGKFLGKDYYIRFVKNWNEIEEKYGEVRYVNTGRARINATVTEDSEAIFTPCIYRVNNVQPITGVAAEPIEEIVSFRGRFCEQAKKGETVIAEGKIERVIDRRRGREHYRLLLGNRPEDFMVLTQPS